MITRKSIKKTMDDYKRWVNKILGCKNPPNKKITLRAVCVKPDETPDKFIKKTIRLNDEIELSLSEVPEIIFDKD